MGIRHAGREQKGAVALEAIPVPDSAASWGRGQDGPWSSEMEIFLQPQSLYSSAILSMDSQEGSVYGTDLWAGLRLNISLAPPPYTQSS